MSCQVHRSLHAKVWEQVGKEVKGMLLGKCARPRRALDAFEWLRLAGPVFAFPSTFPGNWERVGGFVRRRILGVKYACAMGASASAAMEEDTKNCRDEDTEPAAELVEQYRARVWEECTLLLSVLPILIQGQVNKREKLSTKPRSA
jgi:hypothetical protein